MIFTGSTVIDTRNTSGFCTGGKPCMVAVCTGHTPKKGATPALQTQDLAFSNDRGRNWTKYSGNPVLNPIFPNSAILASFGLSILNSGSWPFPCLTITTFGFTARPISRSGSA
jgi:hypothetical protein